MTKPAQIIKPPGKFHGGIHPPEYKTISSETPIAHIPTGPELVIPTQQSIGTDSIPTVSAGDQVTRGQLIARCPEGLGANIHSPESGVITFVGLGVTGHPSRQLKPVIIIKTDEQQPTQSLSQSTTLNAGDWQQQSSDQLLEQISDAGIVGLGGATFPTSIKLSADKIDTLIINAMECEPYITCDDRMLRELPHEVISGARIAAKVVGAKNIIIATEDNKLTAVDSLRAVLEESNLTADIKLMVAPTKYPSGGEKQLIELVTNQQLPAGHLPSSLGLIVQNVATVQAIYQCIVNNKPLTQRLVTITGDQVATPGNYWIPFGTRIDYLIELLKINTSTDNRIIMGGPLMGQSITDCATPVTKSTNCLIFNNKETVNSYSWLQDSAKHQACIRCTECEKVCPVELLPQQLYWQSRSDQWDALENQGLADCIECGACAYVCPSKIPLVQYFRYAKSTVRANKIKQQKSDHAKKRFEFREMRLQRAKEERALKHKKAAEARKAAALNKENDPAGKQMAINQALERVKNKKAAMATSKETSQTNNKGLD